MQTQEPEGQRAGDPDSFRLYFWHRAQTRMWAQQSGRPPHLLPAIWQWYRYSEGRRRIIGVLSLNPGLHRHRRRTPTYREKVLREWHVRLTGLHLGVKKTIGKIRQADMWPGLTEGVGQWWWSCDNCCRRKTPWTDDRFQCNRMALDSLEAVPTTSRGNTYALFIGDYFTRWIQAAALPN